MDVMTLAVAGVAALAILLIAVGVASSGRSGISDRLERYASGQKETKASPQGQGPISDLIAQSQALANLNKVVEQRDFGANLARDIARADLKLKPSEFLFIWAGSIVGAASPASTIRRISRSRSSAASPANVSRPARFVNSWGSAARS